MNPGQQSMPVCARDMVHALRHFLVLVALAFWLGGFTFYASVVIHTGHRVFGGRMDTGFLTQQVTSWLNFSGVIALTVLLANGFIDWRHAPRWMKVGLWLTWVVMVVILVSLYAMHPILDRMLDADGRRILDRAHFHRVHKIYMNLSTTQWAAGLLHLWLTLLVWWSCSVRSQAASPASHAVSAMTT